MKHNNKKNKRKRKLENMCSQKIDILKNNGGSKKKKLKEYVHKTNRCSNFSSESSASVESPTVLHNEVVVNKKSIAQNFEVTQENQGRKSSNQGDSGSKSKPLVDNKNKQKNLTVKNIENVTQKGYTGSNNWEKFLIDQGKQYVIDKNPVQPEEKQKSKTHNSSKVRLTKVVGMDCEMVGTGEDGKDNLLARVSIVNLFGDCLYDKFVKPRETVTDYRTHISGVRASDLKNADDFETVQKEVAALIKEKILVGHAIKNDLEVLFLTHPRHQVRDTSKFFRKRGCGTPSLKKLAAEYLDLKIQSGEHSSIQDAQAAVQLYNMFRKQWESGVRNKRNNRVDSSSNLV